MGIITLPNFRTTADVTAMVRLKDGGLAIDWSGLTGIKAWLYSDAQKAISGRFDVSVNQEDHTLLKCNYSATKPQYLGVNRIIVQAKYHGRVKTYDKAILNFVSRTSDVPGDITIEDPIVDVEIDVQDVSSSILDSLLEAMLGTLEEARSMVDLHRGPKGDTGDTPNITIGTVTTIEPGAQASANMTGTAENPVLNLSIPQGVAGSTPSFKVGEVKTGEPGTPVVVTITGTAKEPILNITIPQGMQGNTGSSVDYPFELVNNLKTNDATKGLSAAQGFLINQEIRAIKTGAIQGSSVSFVGADDTYVSNNATGLSVKGEHTYRFVPTVKEWSHNNVSNADSNCLAIGYENNQHLLYTLSRTLWQFEDYYDVTFPQEADGKELYIGGRADAGTLVEFTVFDITEERKTKSMSLISLAKETLSLSASMSPTYIPVKIKSGRRYVIHSVFPNILIPVQGAQATSSALRIWTVDSSMNAVDTVKQIFYRGAAFQDYFYEFIASEDASYIGFYGRSDYSLSWNVSIGVYPSDFESDDLEKSNIEKYTGEKIRLRNSKETYKEEIIAVQGIASYNGKSQQGLAIYGKYAFLTYDTGYIRVLDLDTMSVVASYAMPEGVQGDNNHAGMANFGPYFYSTEDDFPLLYISSYLENKCYVLRVTTSSCTHVQTISLENAWHFLVDDEGNLIVHMNDWNTYLIFDLPDTSASFVTLSATNAKDNFSLLTPGMQTTGSFCENGKMYILCYYISTPTGVSGQYDRMVVYDYNRKMVVSTVVFNNGSIRTNEFEGLSPTQDGDIMISFVANQLAKLVF